MQVFNVLVFYLYKFFPLVLQSTADVHTYHETQGDMSIAITGTELRVYNTFRGQQKYFLFNFLKSQENSDYDNNKYVIVILALYYMHLYTKS